MGATPIATCAIRPTPGAGSKSAGTATPPVLLDIVQQPSQRPERVRSTRRGGPGRPGVLGNHTMHPAPDEGTDATTFVSTGRLPEPDLVQSILEDAFARVADVSDGEVADYIPALAEASPDAVRCLHGERARPGARGR